MNRLRLFPLILLLSGCSAFYRVHDDECADPADCGRIAQKTCRGPYTVISQTRGDPDDQEWDHEGASPMGNVIINAVDIIGNLTSSTPYVIRYHCGRKGER